MIARDVGSLLPAGFASDRKLVTPLSSLSIALVLSVESSDARLGWIVTAVIGGALLTELLVSRTSNEPEPTDEPEEESTEFDGPEFRDNDGGPA